MRTRRADMPPEIMEAWEQAYKELQAFIEQTDSDREYILYKGASPGRFHLGLWGYDKELLLTGVTESEIKRFVQDIVSIRDSEYIRFRRQSYDALWISRYLRRSWFKFNAIADPYAYKAVTIDDIRAKEQIKTLPIYGGVYVVTTPGKNLDNSGILYVGESENIYQRWKGHDKLNEILDRCPAFYLHCFNQQFFDLSRKRIETLFIYYLNPRFNIQKKRR